MPLPLAAGIFTILIISIGIIHYRLEKRIRTVKKLEKLLADSSRELASLEVLKSRFLSRIGDVLATPLKAIEASSRRLISVDAGIPDDIFNDLQNLSDEVRSLIRIMSVFEEISAKETDMPAGTEIVQMDEIVSEAAMDISEDAADKLVSLSVAICGTVEVAGRKSQLSETVSSILREALKKADSGTLMSVELRIENNMEMETSWTSVRQQASEEQDLLGAGFIRLVASSHGGWLSADMENRRITLILPLAGENQ
ncbi:MAG: hypothetical protein K8S62_03830 [Candidatus Sabulitectum sp.]|nr:hypothetical protein [Candidatus Sabulitectum sp.]